ncbi:protein yellow-like [Bacillus rossius redtenbacheri]|uniref:protein yellow-like n=1 Tax=Bacillus rossius redtenbacheri TaxID=93214 RepID=UPI002FDD21E1
MQRALVLAALLATVLLHGGRAANQLQLRFQWTSPEFVFASEAARQASLAAGTYVPGSPFLLDVDVWSAGHDEKVLVTLPRLKPGTPATLATVAVRPGAAVDSGPLLFPYPDWTWNHQGHCDAITSVFRVKIDPCGRLWVIDSGVVDIVTDFKRICPPQVLVFDVRSNKLVKRYRIPETDLEDESLLINIAVDIRDLDGKCRDAVAYIADVTENSLIVYDANKSRSWRVNSNLFYPYPSAGFFTISGESFDLMDGLFGLALGPIVRGDRTLYFHSLASYRESWVRTSLLRNESLFQNDVNSVARQFQESPGERPSQTAATAMSEDAVLFFNLLSRNTLGCWNSRLPYTSSNLVQLVRDDEALQFVSGMKIVRDRSGREVLWALSCRFQRLMTGSFDPAEVNFRVLTAPVADLVRGTNCGRASLAEHAPRPAGAGGGYRPIAFPN